MKKYIFSAIACLLIINVFAQSIQNDKNNNPLRKLQLALLTPQQRKQRPLQSSFKDRLRALVCSLIYRMTPLLWCNLLIMAHRKKWELWLVTALLR